VYNSVVLEECTEFFNFAKQHLVIANFMRPAIMGKEDDKYTVFRLENGLKVALCSGDKAVSYCGVVVGAGARDERIPGTAHFVEHTIFKGTGRRSSLRINARMESIGGELNAYTTKEETVIYTTAPGGYLERSLDLLADLVTGAIFPQREIEMEKEVVVDEINSYLDSPADRVFDEFEDLIFEHGQPGHNILGTEQSVRSLTREDCLGFIAEFYTPYNMVLYICDATPANKVLRLVRKYFGAVSSLKFSAGRVIPPVNPRFEIERDYGGHQAHTIMGTRTVSKYSDDRWALFLLNNYLAGPGMNSCLNRQLREKRGLVYTVDGIVSMGSDFGMWQVYYGCDRKNVQRCAALITKELQKVAETPIKPAAFEAIRRQYIGQLLVSSQNREAMAIVMGKNLLYYDKVHDVDYSAQRIAAVTSEQFRQAAASLLQSGLSSLTLI